MDLRAIRLATLGRLSKMGETVASLGRIVVSKKWLWPARAPWYSHYIRDPSEVIEPKTVWGTSIAVGGIETESSTVTEMYKTTEVIAKIYKTITIFI